MISSIIDFLSREWKMEPTPLYSRYSDLLQSILSHPELDLPQPEGDWRSWIESWRRHLQEHTCSFAWEMDCKRFCYLIESDHKKSTWIRFLQDSLDVWKLPYSTKEVYDQLKRHSLKGLPVHDKQDPIELTYVWLDLGLHGFLIELFPEVKDFSESLEWVDPVWRYPLQLLANQEGVSPDDILNRYVSKIFFEKIPSPTTTSCKKHEPILFEKMTFQVQDPFRVLMEKDPVAGQKYNVEYDSRDSSYQTEDLVHEPASRSSYAMMVLDMQRVDPRLYPIFETMLVYLPPHVEYERYRTPENLTLKSILQSWRSIGVPEQYCRRIRRELDPGRTSQSVSQSVSQSYERSQSMSRSYERSNEKTRSSRKKKQILQDLEMTPVVKSWNGEHRGFLILLGLFGLVGLLFLLLKYLNVLPF